MPSTSARRARLRAIAARTRQGPGRRSLRNPRNPEGQMPLGDHLRELRSRLLKAVLAFVVATAACLVFYGPLFRLVTEPFDTIRAQYQENEGANVTLNFGTITDPFTIFLKIGGLAGLFLSSPVWLYQLWAFVVPGLHRHERRWALGFVVVSVPLFLGGAVLAYFFLPKGFDLLVGFNPDPKKVANIIGVDTYLSFVTKMFLVFGISFVTPVFLVALNLVGVVRGRTLFRAWRYTTIGAFVFAAVATPSGDPLTMTVLAVPMLLLYFAAAGFSLAMDRRRERSRPAWMAVDDDSAAPLDGPAELADEADPEPERTPAHDPEPR